MRQYRSMDLNSIQELEDELNKGETGIGRADYFEQNEDTTVDVLFSVSFDDLDINSIELEGFLRDIVDAYDQVYESKIEVHLDDTAEFVLTVDDSLPS